MNDREILLASPRGFCAGVERESEIVESAVV
jgi:4-hydroxy-3-methylbut-2-enyl diphosphate reductase IspH